MTNFCNQTIPGHHDHQPSKLANRSSTNPAGQSLISPLQHTTSINTLPPSNQQHHSITLHATSSIGQWETYPIQYSNTLYTQPSSISLLCTTTPQTTTTSRTPIHTASLVSTERRGSPCCDREQEEKKKRISEQKILWSVRELRIGISNLLREGLSCFWGNFWIILGFVRSRLKPIWACMYCGIAGWWNQSLENLFDEMELPWAGNFVLQSSVIKCDNLSWYPCLSS